MQREKQTELCPEIILVNELSRRVERNPHYSARAFAKNLGVSHTLLSMILSSKRGVSKKLAQKMAEVLDLDEMEVQVLKNHKRTAGFETQKSTLQFDQISVDTFALLSDWHHYAILSLMELPSARLEVNWIARKLRISKLDAKLAIERLKRLNMIAKLDGKWKQSTLPLKVENKSASQAIQKHHKQFLNKAGEALDETSFDERDFSAMTFAMDPKFIPYAKKRIQTFRRSLVEELEKMGPPKEVYHLSVQIYPITKKEKKS